ncbi:hypothetical protein H5410_010090 [Solanum commersonii]|uniref:Uncharacterized protein n=1 Tax=Solanum commersonii TaxID=4109 RepID=A0A9J6AJQ8_SOLCO|nr:hypothetical protein H5410_010090 [Solanum commersonii]
MAIRVPRIIKKGRKRFVILESAFISRVAKSSRGRIWVRSSNPMGGVTIPCSEDMHLHSHHFSL